MKNISLVQKTSAAKSWTENCCSERGATEKLQRRCRIIGSKGGGIFKLLIHFQIIVSPDIEKCF